MESVNVLPCERNHNTSQSSLALFYPLFRDFAADKALEFFICPEADSLQHYSTNIR